MLVVFVKGPPPLAAAGADSGTCAVCFTYGNQQSRVVPRVVLVVGGRVYPSPKRAAHVCGCGAREGVGYCSLGFD